MLMQVEGDPCAAPSDNVIPLLGAATVPPCSSGFECVKKDMGTSLIFGAGRNGACQKIQPTTTSRFCALLLQRNPGYTQQRFRAILPAMYNILQLNIRAKSAKRGVKLSKFLSVCDDAQSCCLHSIVGKHHVGPFWPTFLFHQLYVLHQYGC